MGGNRSTKATKGGKYMNPTDQARKEERKKQLKKHKKQREAVREAVIKNKNPNTVLEELSKLDDLEFDTENDCPYADRVMQEKRQRLRSTYFKILEYYKNSNKMDTWKEYQDDFNSYEKERDRKKSLYQAVLKAKNWSVDHIPLPDTPMPDASPFPIAAPIGLPPKKETTKVQRNPPGPPPGPPPDKKKFKRKKIDLADLPNSSQNSSKNSSSISAVQRALLGHAGQDEPDDEDPPPPPPGVPPLENRPKPAAAAFPTQFHPRQQAIPHAQPPIQSHILPQVNYAAQSFAAAHTAFATNEITAAPQVYKPPSAAKAVRGEGGATISSEPIITKPKVATTMFVPTALRSSKQSTTVPAPIHAKPTLSKVRQLAPPVALNAAKKKDPDKAYEKFMAEMSNLM